MGADVMLLLGVGALFLALMLAVGTVVAISAQKQAVGRSLAAMQSMRTAPPPGREDLERSFSERVLDPAMRRLTELGRRLTPREGATRIRHRLDLAGNPPRWDVDRILGFKMVGLLAGLLLGPTVTWVFSRGMVFAVLATAALALLGYFAPNLVLYQAGYNRTERIRRELPDALDLLTISVEAGLAFDAALSQVARNTDGPLADEFFRVLQEMQIGLGRAEALRALADRTDVPELRSFVGAMVQADSFGIPIASVLRVQAKEMRIKRSQRAEEAAQKVPVKILFPLIFCIMPALFVVVLGPAAINILRTFNGS